MVENFLSSQTIVIENGMIKYYHPLVIVLVEVRTLKSILMTMTIENQLLAKKYKE